MTLFGLSRYGQSGGMDDEDMILVAFVFAGVLVSVPLFAIGWLMGVVGQLVRLSVEARRIRRVSSALIAVVLVVAFVAFSSDGTYTPFYIAICLAVGVLVGYLAIEWFVSNFRSQDADGRSITK